MNQNDRKQERVEHLAPVGGQDGCVYDFSQGGVAVFVGQCAKPGSTVMLKVQVGDLNLNVKATVSHCTVSGDLYRAGYQFTDLADDSRTILREMADLYSRGVPVRVAHA